MNRFQVDEKLHKTYSTIKKLDIALTMHGFQDFRHILVHTPSGRVTAVFIDVNANAVIFKGFCWVG
jgi:hypothetical protein